MITKTNQPTNIKKKKSKFEKLQPHENRPFLPSGMQFMLGISV